MAVKKQAITQRAMFQLSFRRKAKLSDCDRFRLLLSQVAGKRLTWAEVTGKVGETAF